MSLESVILGQPRDEWPSHFLEIWGHEKKEITAYLRRVYITTLSLDWNKEHRVETILDVSSKKSTHMHALYLLAVLQWWWRSRYGQSVKRDMDYYPNEFGRWLLSQYNESKKLDPSDHSGDEPRS